MQSVPSGCPARSNRRCPVDDRTGPAPVRCRGGGAAQRERAEPAGEPAARSDEFTGGALNLRTPLAGLLAEPAATDAIRRIVPGLLDTELLTVRGGGSLLQIAAFAGRPGRPQLTELAEELARLFPRSTDHPAVRR
ncbi:hypothetical protein PV394_05180 [Streptomyces sp. NE06-03E]|uniref:hypothetical protein n=1 Tax=Streptomyces sp. NE06-03E TaxID=3028695 RepID=UPI0029B5C860|nr:hypothetical protein [Streptomyces sp. NE06-03E]MDX3054533.1 hypothetical protein [Streptomyces sp. NE06-03E]